MRCHPHVRHPPPEDAPILSSLRQKPLCCPLLAAERHTKLPTSLLSVQRSAVSVVQPSMSNGGEQTPGLWTRALLRLPDAVASSRPWASNARATEKPTPSPFLREHLNAVSRFRPPSGPDVAAMSFASSARTSSAHKSTSTATGRHPSSAPYSTDARHRGGAIW
jgi:hypothetical protein